MNILFYTNFANQRELLTIVKKKFKGTKVITIKDKVNFSKIDVAMVWNLPNIYFKKFLFIKSFVFSVEGNIDINISL